MKKFDIYSDLFWIYFSNKQSNIDINQVKGKYMFFSDDINYLSSLGKEISIDFCLPQFKIPSKINVIKNLPIGYKKHVLCIYDKECRFLDDLKKYSDSDTIGPKWEYDENIIYNNCLGKQ